MALLDQKYRELKPSLEYLLDKVVLAQAWKKSHQHIRSTNWYADTFELDRSAIDLEFRLDEWINQLKKEDFTYAPLALIPAPKSSTWHFERLQSSAEYFFDSIFQEEFFENISHVWQPKIDEDYEDGIKPLRPLAHVGIRDQSLLTALMMCLANEVETLQGDTSTDFDEVHQTRVVNYGNRLYCQFNQSKAEFSWGNSTTYSKYFSDYQHFLARPAHFGREAMQRKVAGEAVYEVHLDIEKFFDRVQRALLVEKLQDLVGDDDAVINRLLKAFETWQWEDDAEAVYRDVCGNGEKKVPQGIPQGLVAGGFFANVYLLDFDHSLAELIGTQLGEGVRLIDYCRYVDDMRLILVVDRSATSSINEAVNNIIASLLGNLGLALNEDKTRIDLFRSKKSGTALKLKDIQRKVSGPLSINEIDEQLGHLEGLIGLAESLRLDDIDKDNNNPLALIERPSNDVGEDTLLRFSANKIQLLLKQKRSLVAQEVDENGVPVPAGWDFLQERMARKFIACWSKDPSLVLLLKKGLELFPDNRLLKPVASQLMFAMKRNSPKQRLVAEYCLCEIFRHAATIIHTKDRWASPAHADINVFFESLQHLAIVMLDPKVTANAYLGQQARFYLLVRNDSLLDKETSDKHFNTIIKLVKGFRNVSAEMSLSDFVANALLAYQLGRDRHAVVRAVSTLLEKISKKTKLKKSAIGLTRASTVQICRRLAKESMEFFAALVSYGKDNDHLWPDSILELIAQSGISQVAISGDLQRFSNASSIPVSLMGIIKRNDNPLAHENAAIKLLLAAIDNEGALFQRTLDLANCKVSADNWAIVQGPSATITLELAWSDEDDIFPIPQWVSTQHKPLYRVGMLLRSCLLGSIDWSSSNNAFVTEMGYFGLKTSFYKRQLGMMHSPEAINGESSPMSGWLSSLLFHLLQWPGVKLNDGGYGWPNEWTLASLKALLQKRLEYQYRFYCHATEMPAYVERVKLEWPEEKTALKVVMVQSLLPLKDDFASYGLMLDTPVYRARHRRHVAAVAELLLHKVFSQKSIDDDNFKNKTDIDLIIWPELSVHHDDIDILKRLSDKTGAMIFAGLTFAKLPGVRGPNNIAKWIVPKRQGGGRQFITRLQGKQHMMADEVKAKVQPWRPYQLMIELMHPSFPDKEGFIITGSICYDATDIKLSADLKGKSHAYIIPSLNKDVSTFDSMVDALYYHMYQHVTLVNTGEFGGSVAKAPYKERHEKLITHVHGADQVSISTFDMNMFDFRNIGKSYRSGKEIKTKPAG